MPVVVGNATATEPGVSGFSGSGYAGVRGSNTGTGVGVRGFADHSDGVRGDSKDGGAGVRGISYGNNHVGVVGESKGTGNGVLGIADSGVGVYAISKARGHGVYAEAQNGVPDAPITGGIDGLVASRAAVLGKGMNISVLGLVNPGGWHPEPGLSYARYSIGVCGAFPSHYPNSDAGREAPLPWDVPFVSARTGSYPHIGVYGLANGALVGVCPFSGGYGLIVSNTKGGKSAAFQGDVELEGDLAMSGAVRTLGRDCAEAFDLADDCVGEPGTVLVAGEDGRLSPCTAAYDKAVVGIVSGAGEERPGIVLGGGRADAEDCAPIALIGRVWCKVDASFGAIKLGDMLTTSPTPGHAMKAADKMRAPGSIIGKALKSIPQGCGMVPVLVALQ
ncbi:MAG: hypothetical protein NWP98_04050 [Erythrobacter sp.]|nr:hypothetical protein [Erythrobacter sp.]